jgi:hypothetical protein
MYVIAIPGGSEREVLPGQTSEFVWSGIQPGSVEVVCYPVSEPSHDGRATQELTVVDPDRLFTSSDVQCPNGLVNATVFDYIDPSTAVPGTPVEVVAARAHGLQSTDDLRLVGYPSARSAVVAVERGGPVVAIFGLASVEQGWLVQGFSTCADSGITA